MPHAEGCDCGLCRHVRSHAVATQQSDRDTLALEWERWIGGSDGEVAKLRAGEDGNPASPRWVALQAIARARLAASIGVRAVGA